MDCVSNQWPIFKQHANWYFILIHLYIAILLESNVSIIVGKTLVEHLVEENILPGGKEYPNCNQPMRLLQSPAYADTCLWISYYVKKRRVSKAMSVRTGTWFAESRLSLIEMVSNLKRLFIQSLIKYWIGCLYVFLVAWDDIPTNHDWSSVRK